MTIGEVSLQTNEVDAEYKRLKNYHIDIIEPPATRPWEPVIRKNDPFILFTLLV